MRVGARFVIPKSILYSYVCFGFGQHVLNLQEETFWKLTLTLTHCENAEKMGGGGGGKCSF